MLPVSSERQQATIRVQVHTTQAHLLITKLQHLIIKTIMQH